MNNWALEPPKGYEMRIWTEAYRPFLFGGDVNGPVATEVEATLPLHAGKGVDVCVIHSPYGTTHIAEMSTGALVGTDLVQVRSDIAAADKTVLLGQIDAALRRAKKARQIPAREFWNMIAKC